MAIIPTTTIFLFALIAAVTATRTGPCYPGCKFYLSSSTGFTQEYAVAYGEAGRPFTNVFYNANSKVIGKVHSLGEAYNVDNPLRPIRISAWQPKGLSRSFYSDFFRPVSFPNTLFSGVTHAKVYGNQKQFLNKRCWVLPITDYTQLVVRAKKLVEGRRVHPKSKLRDCVAIETFTFP